MELLIRYNGNYYISLWDPQNKMSSNLPLHIAFVLDISLSEYINILESNNGELNNALLYEFSTLQDAQNAIEKLEPLLIMRKLGEI